MAVGLLIDAFLVRTILVQALMVLIGNHSGWPRWRLGATQALALPSENRAPQGKGLGRKARAG